jgi:hypothetical protein
MEEMTMEEKPEPGKENTHLPVQIPSKNNPAKTTKPEVVVVRTFKEYLGESLLIIFSVVLALILTETFNKIHEDHHTSEVLHQLRQELIDNKRLEGEQYQYHLQVLKNIDSALHKPALAKEFIDNGKLSLKGIAPEGVIRHDLNNVAWEIAKQNNVFSKIDLTTYSLLTDIYDNQQRITNSEEKIGAVLLSWESRKPENLRTTLILVRDNYLAWDIERAPKLLHLYQQAIQKLSGY